MSRRPKHVNDDIERVLREAEDRGWVFTLEKGGKFRGRCRCGKHSHFIVQGAKPAHRTAQNLASQLNVC